MYNGEKDLSDYHGRTLLMILCKYNDQLLLDNYWFKQEMLQKIWKTDDDNFLALHYYC